MPILETRPSCIDNHSILTASLFAHLQNSNRLRGSWLAGSTFSNTIDYVKKMLAFLQQKEKLLPEANRAEIQASLKSLEEKFSSLIDYEGRIEKIRTNIDRAWEKPQRIQTAKEQTEKLAEEITQTLMTKGTVMLPGGWRGSHGKPGHAMMYQLTVKKPEGNVILLVENTGAGIQNHAIKRGEKNQFYPTLAFEIPKEMVNKYDIADVIAELLKPMIQPQLINPKSTDIIERSEEIHKYSYDEARVYGEIFPKLHQLKAKKIDPRPYCKAQTQGQWDGTCSMRVLMPLLRNELSPHVFQELLYEVKLQSIIDFYRIHKNNLSDPTVQHALRPAVEKLARSTRKWMAVSKRRKTGFRLDEQRARENLELCDSMLTELKAKLTPQKLETKLNTEMVRIEDELSTVFKVPKPPRVAELELKGKLDQTLSEQALVPLPEFHLKQDDPLAYIEKCFHVIQGEQAKGLGLRCINLCEEFFKNFPLQGENANNYYARFTPEQAQKAHIMIQEMIQLYTGECSKHNAGLPYPQRIITLYSGLCLATRTATIAQPAAQEYHDFYPISNLLANTLSSFKFTTQKPHFVSYKLGFDERISEITRYSAELDPVYQQYHPSPWSWPRPKFEDKRAPQERFNDYLADLLRNSPGLASEREKEGYNTRPVFKKLIRGEIPVPDEPLVKSVLAQYKMGLTMLSLPSTITDFSKGFPNLNTALEATTPQFQNQSIKTLLTDKPGYYDSNQVWTRRRDEMIKSFLEDKIKGNPLDTQEQQVVEKLLFVRQNDITQIPVLLEIFGSNLHLLGKSDYQTFLSLCIFDPLVLEKALILNPTLADKLLEFIERGITYHSKGSNLQGAAFYFLKTAAFLHKNFLKSSQVSLLIAPLKRLETIAQKVQKQINDLEQGLSVSGKGDEKTRADETERLIRLYEIYLLNLDIQTEPLAKLEVTRAAQILRANFFVNNMIPEKSASTKMPRDPNISREAQECVERIREKLIDSIKSLEKKSELALVTELLTLNPLFKNSQDLLIEGIFPNYLIRSKTSDELFRFDLISGKIQSEIYIVQPLPDEFYTPGFSAIFGNEPRVAKLRITNTEKVAELSTDQGNFRIIIDSKGTHIQKKSRLDNAWYELLDKDQYTGFKKRGEYSTQGFIPPILLEKGNTLWYSSHQNKGQYIITDNTGVEIAQCNAFDASVYEQEIKKLNDQLDVLEQDRKKKEDILEKTKAQIQESISTNLPIEIEKHKKQIIQKIDDKLALDLKKLDDDFQKELANIGQPGFRHLNETRMRHELEKNRSYKQESAERERYYATDEYSLRDVRYAFESKALAENTEIPKLQHDISVLSNSIYKLRDEKQEKQKHQSKYSSRMLEHIPITIKKVKEGKLTEYSLVNLAEILKSKQKSDLYSGSYGEQAEYARLSLLSSTLTSFEDPNFTLYWQKSSFKADGKTDETPIVIELPRYGLSFEAERDADGTLQFIWTQDRNYRLSVPRKNVGMPGFEAELVLEKIASNKVEDTLVIIPDKHWIIPVNDVQKEIPKEGPYYQYHYDTGDAIRFHWVENHVQAENQGPRHQMPETIDEHPYTRITGWHFSNNAKHYRFKLDSSGNLILKTNEEKLIAAYLYLGAHQPEKAWALLKNFKLSNDIREIELLRRLICDIPERLGRTAARTIEDKITVSDPEVIALQVHCAKMLAEQQIYSKKPPDFNIKTLSSASDYNTVYQQIENQQLNTFYESGYYYRLFQLMNGYERLRGSIPVDMQLSLEDEYILLAQCQQKKQEQPLVGSLHRRWREIQKNHKTREMRLLQLKEQYSKDLYTREDQDRLDQLRVSIAKKQPLLVYEAQFTKELLPLKPEMPTVLLDKYAGGYGGRLSAIFDRSEYINQGHFRFNRSTYAPAKLASQGLWANEETFIYTFEDLYRLASSPGEDNDKKSLREFIALVLKAGQDNQFLRPKPPHSIMYQLSSLLAYVLETPTAFPELARRSDYGRESEQHMSDILPEVYATCLQLSKSSPIFIDTEVMKNQPVLKDFAIKPRKKTGSIDGTIPITPDDTLKQIAAKNIYEELNLQALYQDIQSSNAMERKTSQESSETESLFKASSFEHPFHKREITIFNEEHSRGIRDNAKIKERSNIYAKTLGNREIQTNLLTTLSKFCDDNQKILKTSELALINTANKKINSKEASERLRAEFFGRQREKLELPDLIGLYLRNDIELYHRKTGLKKGEILELHNNIHAFLVQSTKNQQRERSIKLLNDLKTTQENDLNYSNLLYKLGEELTAIRQYTPALDPEILVFEYSENKRVWPLQAKFIHDLTIAHGDSYKSKIIQMVMGGGKTKVLLPLLALRKANGSNLSLIEVPAALFKTNVADLQAASLKHFGQKGFAFEFSRETPITAESLKVLYRNLQEAMRNRNYVISTAESIQSVELKYFELLYQGVPKIPGGKIISELSDEEKTQFEEKKTEWEQSLANLEKILKTFKYKTDVIIDEVDSVLDARKELNYTVGSAQSIPLSYRETLVALCALFPKVPLPECGCTLQEVMKGEKLIPNEGLWKKVMERLADKLLEETDSPLYPLIQTLKAETKMGSEDLQSLKKYLLQPNVKENIDMPSFIQNLPPNLSLWRKKVALLKGSFNLLPTVLKREPNVHYGLTRDPKKLKEREIAIPYVGNNIPNEQARFGTSLETALFTLQIQANQNLSFDVVKRFINEFVQRSKKQQQEIFEATDTIVNLDETEAGVEFKKLTSNKKISDINPDNVELLKKLINDFSQTPKVREHCLSHYILAEVTNHPQIIRSNPQNHVRQVRSRQGITGTPSNYRNLQSLMSYRRKETLGTDGQTIDHILQKGKDSPVHVPSQKTPGLILQEIFSNHKNPEKISAFIDLGALFKGKPNLEVAQGIANHYRGRKSNLKYVLFFNEAQVLCGLSIENGNIKEIGSSEPAVIKDALGCGPLEYFTYYDQVRARGTDIDQPLDGIGLLTVGLNSNEVDLRQAAMRMRGLPNNQNVEFIVPPEVAEARGIQKQDWTVREVVKMSKEVDLRLKPEDHFRSAIQEFSAVVHDELRKVLLSIEEPSLDIACQKKAELFTAFESVFVSTFDEDPEILYGGIDTEQNVKKVLRQMALDKYAELLMLLEKANVHISKKTKIKSTLLDIADRQAKGCLKQMKYAAKSQEGRAVLVETRLQQKLKETIDEQQPEVNVAKPTLTPNELLTWPAQTDPLQFRLSDWPKNFPAIRPLTDMLSTGSPSKQPDWSFDSEIYVTANFAKTYQEQTDLTDNRQKPLFVFLLIENPKTNRLESLLMTQEDADVLIKQFYEKRNELQAAGRRYWFMTPHENCVHGSSATVDHPDYLRILEQVCFINGDSDVLRNKSERLSWLTSGPHLSKKLDFMDTKILNAHPEKRVFFQSLLKKLEQTSVSPEVLLFRQKQALPKVAERTTPSVSPSHTGSLEVKIRREVDATHPEQTGSSIKPEKPEV